MTRYRGFQRLQKFASCHLFLSTWLLTTLSLRLMKTNLVVRKCKKNFFLCLCKIKKKSQNCEAILTSSETFDRRKKGGTQKPDYQMLTRVIYKRYMLSLTQSLRDGRLKDSKRIRWDKHFKYHHHICFFVHHSVCTDRIPIIGQLSGFLILVVSSQVELVFDAAEKAFLFVRWIAPFRRCENKLK